MNLGQIFEAVLGWAGKTLDVKFATPIFDGASIDDLNEWTDKAGIPRYGKTYLYDGGTGERFDQPATVGVTYFLKLGHMVNGYLRRTCCPFYIRFRHVNCRT